MASTYWKPFQGSETQGVVCLHGTWTINASDGAVASRSGALYPQTVGAGIFGSNSQMVYFSNPDAPSTADRYTELLGVSVSAVNDSGFAAAESVTGLVIGDYVNADAGTVGQSGVVLEWVATADAADATDANLATKTFHATVWLKNSSV